MFFCFLRFFLHTVRSNATIFFKQLYLTHREDVAVTITMRHIDSGSNGNEKVLQTLQIFRTRASPSDAVYCLYDLSCFVASWILF